MRKSITLSQRSEEILKELRLLYLQRMPEAKRITDGWLCNHALEELYNREKESIKKLKSLNL